MARTKVRQMSRSTLKQEILLNRITNRIRNSLELQEILTTTAREIRSFLGSDRVKVYRFEVDGSGEVIAESTNGDNLPSLLGLRFPAGDIPNSAREMFLKARQRVIVDVELKHQTINRLDCPETGKTLAVEDITYCPVDPCHAEYLKAMGARSSLTVPILHQNQLWGLLACHHSQPKRFSDRELKMVQLLVDQLSIAIAQSFLLSQARRCQPNYQFAALSSRTKRNSASSSRTNCQAFAWFGRATLHCSRVWRSAGFTLYLRSAAPGSRP